jgi:hypothetical protein
VRLAVAAALCAACGSGGGFPDAAKPPPPPGPGSVALDWKLQNSAGQPVTCTSVNATTVFVDMRDADTAAAFSATFSCPIGTGVSGAIPSSTYDIRFSLINNNGTIASAPPQNAIVVPAYKTTQLTPITFVIF